MWWFVVVEMFSSFMFTCRCVLLSNTTICTLIMPPPPRSIMWCDPSLYTGGNILAAVFYQPCWQGNTSASYECFSYFRSHTCSRTGQFSVWHKELLLETKIKNWTFQEWNYGTDESDLAVRVQGCFKHVIWALLTDGFRGLVLITTWTLDIVQRSLRWRDIQQQYMCLKR